MELPSTILAQAVDSLSGLPGVGKRSAMRYALHLLKQTPEVMHYLSETEIDQCFTLEYYMKNVDYIFNQLGI